MNVLFVSAEADPFAKVGGLADVVGSLPRALRQMNIDARVVMPHYRFIDPARYRISGMMSFPLPRRPGTTTVEISTTLHHDVPFYFLRGWPFFGEEPTVYSGWGYDVPRFVFFAQAVIAFVDELRMRHGWFPDVIHVHDWHTGLLPFLIDVKRGWDAPWRTVGTLLTLHNMAYQGDHAGGWLWEQGIPGRDHYELQSRGLSDNLLAMSIAYSDILTAVSPRYAIEIQYPYMGFGLEGMIRTRLPDLYGILNGIDVDEWNPATDPKIATHYDADNFETRRALNKRHLQSEIGLPVRAEVPLIGVVSRLVWQKGFDLGFPAIRQLLAEDDVQFVGLGSGEAALDYELWRIGADFHTKARGFVGYNAAVAQQIYAGCDLFLMPSHYEPCGTSQMISMRYGALPVVRETGGLADTVINYDDADGETGTGFRFSWEEPEAVLGTLRWAVRTFRERPAAWKRMQERAMRTDFSWHKSGREYIALYEQAAARHH